MTDPKSKILARRARFLAAAATSAGLVAGMVACSSEETSTPSTVDAGKDSEADTEPMPCLAPDIGPDDTGPMPCLEPPLDSGADTGPMPCLDPPFDSGMPETDTVDTGPMPCLVPPPGDAG